MKKRWHQSIGCFGFRRPHFFSKPVIFSEEVKSENPPIQDCSPGSPTFTKIQNSPTFNDSDIVLNAAPMKNGREFLKNVMLFDFTPYYRYMPMFHFSALKVDPSKIEKNVDFDIQYEKQANNNGKCCYPNYNISEDVYKCSSTSSCTNYVNSTAGKYSDEKLISRSYIFGTPAQRPVYPANFFPLLESNPQKIRNDSSSSELKSPSTSLFANEQREMVEELQATKLILLKLKRLLIETPTTGKSVCSSAFTPTNTYSNSLHSHRFIMCHCDLNEGKFPSTTADNRPLPLTTNKPVNRTGLEELIDSLSQLHFEKSEILVVT
ncbi:hypothetical protein KSF78_0002971 [Schistosoma japonicum]|nr:hypothetical protein KSF78_0002971 [Schistosoma japonicum]